MARRPGKLVDPATPGVRFVEIMPRANWQRAMLDSTADVGFFRIDAAEGVLLFEPEVERWTCPISAVSAAVLAESGVPGQQAVVYVVFAASTSCDSGTRRSCAHLPVAAPQYSHSGREVKAGQVQHCTEIFVPAASGPSSSSAAVRRMPVSCPLTGHLTLSMSNCQQSAVMVSDVAPGGQSGSD